MKYTFEPRGKRPRFGSYREEELRGMTILQLQDVCEREGIIHAALDRLDREELIHLVMTYRGTRDRLLLSSYDETKMARLQQGLSRMNIIELPCDRLRLPSKISLFDGLDTDFFDDYRVGYRSDLDGVNAFVLDRDGVVCAVMRLVSYHGYEDDLFLTRLAVFPCREADVHDYRLLLCPQKFSDELTGLYNGNNGDVPREAQAYAVSLLAYEVCTPEDAPMPLAVDFGTSNTAAGVYMSRSFFSKIERHIKPGQLRPDNINYLYFLSPAGETLPVLPTVIGVERIESGNIDWRFGFAADGMMAQGYLGQGVCVFYDIKRWAASYNDTETLTDSEGRQAVIARKDIIKAYLGYVIRSAEQRFKCHFKKLFLSYPVKQRERFISLYREIFAEYDLMESEMFDEGIAVLYGIIGTLIDTKQYRENVATHALILDCGGGTTDQSSASFCVRTGRTAYEIDITTAYENGDTDFGGNNLTFRLMQLLKIEAARHLAGFGKSLAELTRSFSFDQYRTVDDAGREAVYRELEEAYRQAEAVIPTRYREYEYSGRNVYYMVYNNFHYFFALAERVKKAFFGNDQILRIVVSSEDIPPQPDMVHIKASRWKLAMSANGALTIRKHLPKIGINTYQVRAVFMADIYDIFRRFIGRLYAEGELSQYGIVKLTGQSCKIGLFRDSLKEYVPGALIRQGQSLQADNFQLKLTCLEGAIRYLRDKTLGLTKVSIKYGRPALPYVLTARTHNGDPVTLIKSLDREHMSGMVSRYIAASEVELTLGDTRGNEKYKFLMSCDPASFQKATYDQIETRYGGHIPQEDVDTIENGEVRYFVWADAGQWGFSLVPVARRDEDLHIGPQQLRSFENESWMVNYFDGLH
ncbi:MAG: hypothetical protein LBH28_04000 [Oscillospiraceae bacterium]|jgi:hypothetical protein|nr:hypothetical protein [Oscillospiraceae bacterium]